MVTPRARRAARTGWHLVRRFVGSLRPGGPPAADDEWARGHLLAGEAALWTRLPAPDRRHAVGVARTVVDRLGERAGRPVVAAALLHDAGKIESNLGTLARVGATLAGLAGGRRRAPGWSGEAGWRGAVGRYLLHPDIGARLLTDAGSDPLTVGWARSHHRSPASWDPAVPAWAGQELKAADDD